jgi:hypothetical protein
VEVGVGAGVDGGHTGRLGRRGDDDEFAGRHFMHLHASVRSGSCRSWGRRT